MKFFTRITTTLERAVSQLENHDAVVEVAIKDTRTAIAKSRTRLARVQKDGDQLRQKLIDLTEQEKRWKTRAIEIAKSDEDKALACMGRYKHCQAQLTDTTNALTQHEQMEQQLRQNLLHIEQKLENLIQQRNHMRSRHSTADAMRIINSVEDNSVHHLEDTFERWETQIMEAEYKAGTNTSLDPLDDEFIATETTQELRLELDALLEEKS